jgi:rfaE bifunctional protein kinase chain/domain
MILPDFSNVTVLVIGDVMLDRYLIGTVSRISPEAPVPVVLLSETKLAAGGAANVAANIIGLGAKVILVGIIGVDEEAIELKKSLTETNISANYLMSSSTRKTSVKTRIIAHNHHIVRIDQETILDLDATEEDAACAVIRSLIGESTVVLISDYAKGFLTNKIIAEAIKIGIAASKFVTVDPKGKDFSKYAGASLLTPNKKEALEASVLDSSNLNEIGKDLLDKNKISALLITEGEDGMSLFQREDQTEKFSSVARKVFDVTGAGDTVIATLSVALGSGMNIIDSVRLANIAAGVVVETVGTTTIARSELEDLA